MKKILLLLACASFLAISCDKDDNNKDSNGDFIGDLADKLPGGSIIGGSASEELAPDEQKVKLEQVAEDLMNECQAEDFEDYFDIVDSFAESDFSEDYDLEQLYEWMEESINKAYFKEEDIKISMDAERHTTSIELILFLSNHTGLFTFGTNGVTISDYDGTKAVINHNGKEYTLDITKSGKETKAVISKDRYYAHRTHYYPNENGSYSYNEDSKLIEEITSVTIEVLIPEELNIKLTENGSELCSVKVNFAANFKNENVTLSTDALSIDFSFKFGDYEFLIKQLSYNGTTGKATLSEEIKKGGQSLIKVSAGADLKVSEITDSYEEGKPSDDYYYKEERPSIKVESCKNLVVSIDIMNQIQIIGACSNLEEAFDAYHGIYESLYDGNEREAERHLNNLNAKIDFGVFYDKGNNKQADLEFDYEYESHADGYFHCELIPIIVFSDGSKYSAEDYFVGEEFERIFESFMNFCSSYSDSFSGFFEKVESDVEQGL